MVGGEATEFRALDGRRLVGRIFRPEERARWAVLIAGGTGLRQQLYFGIADELRARGALCLAFDYRDIGASRGEQRLAESKTLKQHWGELDLPAALDHLAAQAPGLPVRHLGHSAGAQLVGLMPNVGRIDRMAHVAGSSGYMRRISGRTRWLAYFLIRIYLPLSSRLLGYALCRPIGWGENLPAGVALQWADWCSKPGYVSNAFGRTIDQHYFDEIRCPVLNVRCADDPIASEANVDDFLRLLPNAEVERLVLDPGELGLERLGHTDFFRARNRAAWQQVLDWLTEPTGEPG